MPKYASPVVAGIDLAGSPRRPTGLCVLRDLKAETRVVFSDDDIIDLAKEARPTLIPIDAPLNLPNSRRTIHDHSGEHLRECGQALLSRSICFFPVTLGPMRMLTEPGLALKSRLAAMGDQTVECFPGAAQDLRGDSSTAPRSTGLADWTAETGPARFEKVSNE